MGNDRVEILRRQPNSATFSGIANAVRPRRIACCITAD
jgi:hypothetical protein